ALQGRLEQCVGGVEDLAQGGAVGRERGTQLVDEHGQILDVHRAGQRVEVGQQRLHRERGTGPVGGDHVTVAQVGAGVRVGAQIEVLLPDGRALGDHGAQVRRYGDPLVEHEIDAHSLVVQGDRTDLPDRYPAVGHRRVGVDAAGDREVGVHDE